MVIRWLFLVGLLAGAAALVLLVVVPRFGPSPADRARTEQAAAMAAQEQLKVPADFVRVYAGCEGFYRCYRVAQRPPDVARELPAIMRTMDATPTYTLHEACMGPRASPEYALSCSYIGEVDGNNILIELQPYEDCTSEPCRITSDSRVSVAPPVAVEG